MSEYIDGIDISKEFGMARMIYVDGDARIDNQCPSSFDVTYRLGKALSSDSTTASPVWGIALQDGYLHCGWIRDPYFHYLLRIIDLGYIIECTLHSRKKFYWEDEDCYHGSVMWEVVGKVKKEEEVEDEYSVMVKEENADDNDNENIGGGGSGNGQKQEDKEN
ncbi:uncharacterized protein H6S33_007169 [Morchella sextelata]|uniref:uncharacterized protein n=1 Tax=Morchella sextelata TaxID=1174677 RepID=UPI001D03FBC5|nr:uncharacterized protein H6S33_007169 [Morchella sextelata]KAH0604138.1 hypothetical protein H6S33_007169 [Morchella sextelata]